MWTCIRSRRMTSPSWPGGRDSSAFTLRRRSWCRRWLAGRGGPSKPKPRPVCWALGGRLSPTGRTCTCTSWTSACPASFHAGSSTTCCCSASGRPADEPGRASGRSQLLATTTPQRNSGAGNHPAAGRVPRRQSSRRVEALLWGMRHERRTAEASGVIGPSIAEAEPGVVEEPDVRRGRVHHPDLHLQPIELLLDARARALLHRQGTEEEPAGRLTARFGASG